MFCRRWFLAALALAAFCLVWPGGLLAQSKVPDSSSQPPAPAPKPGSIDILVQPLGKTPVARARRLPEIKFPNFASCPIAEIQQAVPELAHLQAEQDQSQLSALLDKIGAETVEIASKTANLVSHEVVVTERDPFTTRTDYSFLILQHDMGANGRVFDEYRVDAENGKKLETDFIEKAGESSALPAASSPAADVRPAGPILPKPESKRPTSQGFVSAWLYFYPTNRNEFEFRFLGQQKMDGRQTLVVAFAQKPGSVELPALYGYNGRTYRIFMQGVAWIDPAEFRILRLRSDLLSVPAGLPLRQLSVDIEFGRTPIVDVPSPLWLPTQAVITTNLAGSAARERHSYSDYRLFRAQSKIVLK